MQAAIPIIFVKAIPPVGHHHGNDYHDSEGLFASAPGGAAKKESAQVAPSSSGPVHSLPSSAGITSYGEAVKWWRTNLGGKTLNFVVHTGKGEKSRARKIQVRFPYENDHAFTEDKGGKQKTGQRIFDVQRAQAMSRIPEVIENPYAKSIDHGADLLFEGKVNHKHYTVVLQWRKALKVYDLQSAHYKSAEEVSRLLLQQDRQRNEGPLQKSEPPRLNGIYPISLPVLIFGDKPETVFAGHHSALRRGTPSGGHRPKGSRFGVGNGLPPTIMLESAPMSSPFGGGHNGPLAKSQGTQESKEMKKSIPLVFFKSLPAGLKVKKDRDEPQDPGAPGGILGKMPSDHVGAAARGDHDLNKYAKAELAYRGMDSGGKWVGFDEAEEHHGVKGRAGGDAGGPMTDFFKKMPPELLALAASGKVDLNALAKKEAAARGVDGQGKWVGFDRAKKIHAGQDGQESEDGQETPESSESPESEAGTETVAGAPEDKAAAQRGEAVKGPQGGPPLKQSVHTQDPDDTAIVEAANSDDEEGYTELRGQRFKKSMPILIFDLGGSKLKANA